MRGGGVLQQKARGGAGLGAHAVEQLWNDSGHTAGDNKHLSGDQSRNTDCLSIQQVKLTIMKQG